jgi:hypothetical protein
MKVPVCAAADHLTGQVVEPSLDRGSFVGAAVVHDQVDLQMRGDLFTDPDQELGGIQCLDGRPAISTTSSPGPRGHRGHRPRTTRPSPLSRRPITASPSTTSAATSAGAGRRPGHARAHPSRGHGSSDGGDMGYRSDSASFRSPWRKPADCRTAPPAHHAARRLTVARHGHCRGDEGAVRPDHP